MAYKIRSPTPKISIEYPYLLFKLNSLPSTRKPEIVEPRAKAIIIEIILKTSERFPWPMLIATLDTCPVKCETV